MSDNQLARDHALSVKKSGAIRATAAKLRRATLQNDWLAVHTLSTILFEDSCALKQASLRLSRDTQGLG